MRSVPPRAFAPCGVFGNGSVTVKLGEITKYAASIDALRGPPLAGTTPSPTGVGG